MKLSIYQAMRDQGVTQAALGECIGVDGRQVRREIILRYQQAQMHRREQLLFGWRSTHRCTVRSPEDAGCRRCHRSPAC